MKQMKPIVTKTVSGVIASSILMSSCMQGYNFEDSLYGVFADNPATKGNVMLSINESNLSKEFIHQITSINAIIEKILTNDKEAEKFVTNPQAYLSSQEMNFQIMLSEQEKALLLALNDKDIVYAINNNDIALFLKICKEKGYLNTLNENRVSDLRNIFNNTSDYDALIDDIEVRFIAFFIIVAAALVFVGAVAAVATATATTAVTVTKAATMTKVKVLELADEIVRINTVEPVLKIWTDNHGLIANSVLYDEFIECQTNEIADMIEKELVLSDTKREQMKHLLKLQLEGYYGLRK